MCFVYSLLMKPVMFEYNILFSFKALKSLIYRNIFELMMSDNHKKIFTKRVIQHPSFEFTGLPLCSMLNKPEIEIHEKTILKISSIRYYDFKDRLNNTNFVKFYLLFKVFKITSWILQNIMNKNPTFKNGFTNNNTNKLSSLEKTTHYKKM